MIRLENISKTFNAGTAGAVPALKNVTLEMNRGEFAILLGANGSGKSTLLNILTGTLIRDSGKFFIGEKEVSTLPEYKRSKWIARVFQNPLAGTAAELSILENFRLAAIRTRNKTFRIGTGDKFRRQVEEKIAGLGLGLEQKINQPMGTLSGGQRQALTLLMAVMDDVDILLLDEPTAALDPKTSVLIMKIANDLISKFNLTAILVTHNLKDAVQYGTRIIQMNEGAVVRDVVKSGQGNPELAVLYSWFD